MSSAHITNNSNQSVSQGFTIPCTGINLNKNRVARAVLAAVGVGLGGFWGLMGGIAAGYAIPLMIDCCKKGSPFQNKIEKMVTDGRLTDAAKQEILKVQNSIHFDREVQSLIDRKIITHGNGLFILIAHDGANDFNQWLSLVVQRGHIQPGRAYHVLTAHRQFGTDSARFKARMVELQSYGVLTEENVRQILIQSAPVAIAPRLHLASASPILSFLDGGLDAKGRTYDGILSYTDKRLEDDHDWVQQVFPTFGMSQFRADAAKWSVTPYDAAAIKSSPARQSQMRKAYARVLKFFQLDSIPVGVIPRWVTPGNHNFLRVTRILNSLKMAGLKTEAQDFMNRLKYLKAYVDPKSFGFWESAASQM